MTAEELLAQADLALMGQKRERLQLEGGESIRQRPVRLNRGMEPDARCVSILTQRREAFGRLW